MNTLESITNHYLDFCKNQRRLNEKTIKAYQNLYTCCYV